MEFVDPAFSGISKNNRPDGLKIWRVENLALKLLDENEYGIFSRGDSYLIYHTAKGKTNLYTWIGDDSSEDEQGVAAIKMVELDQLLGDVGVPQHTQFHPEELKSFVAIFNGLKLEYRDGGVKSGFKHVDKDMELQLFQIKGKHHVTVSQVPVSETSLNKGDCFVLRKDKVFVLTGTSSSINERCKALQFAQELRDELITRTDKYGAQVVFLEPDPLLKSSVRFWDLPLEYREFCGHLGLTNRLPTIKEACAGGDDSVPTKCTLYRVSAENDSDPVKIKEIGSAPLSRSLLDTEDSFILEAPYQIFVWKGKGASTRERTMAYARAQGFRQVKNLPEKTAISVEFEDNETSIFKSNFYDWPLTPCEPLPTSPSRIAKIEKKRFDMATLNKVAQPKSQLFDDGTGKVQIWRSVNFKMESVPESDYGTFFTGDSYIILYSYKEGCRDKYLIYYWIGDNSTGDEEGTVAYFTKEMDDSLGGQAIQIRIKEGKETEHFMLLFKGKMIVYKGGAQSGFRNVQERQEKKSEHLLRVRGTNDWNIKVIEVDLTATSLSSNDCFILETAKNCYIWFGKNSSGDEQELARSVAGKLCKRESFNFQEGKEPKDFWDALGGKKPYAVEKLVTKDMVRHSPRLFEVSNASGNLIWTEVFDFDQDDMDEDDVMILDTFDTIYIWVGNGARTEEKTGALDLIKDYLAHDPAGRNPLDVMTMILNQGNEPLSFTSQFDSWRPELFQKKKETFNALRQSIIEENQLISAADLEKKIRVKRFYPKDVLEKKDGLPEDVDPCHKEKWLHDDVFENIFQMSKEKFKHLPKWQQQNKKKAANLY